MHSHILEATPNAKRVLRRIDILKGVPMSEHIVATFDKGNAADAAARDLENACISASAIRQ